MKKIILILAGIVCLCACRPQTEEGVNKPNEVYVNGEVAYPCTLVDVSINGETHQYIRSHNTYGDSYSHWEGCKYCKEQEKYVEK